ELNAFSSLSCWSRVIPISSASGSVDSSSLAAASIGNDIVMAFILPGHRRLHEPGLVGGDDQLRTVAGCQLGQQPAHVGLHRGATTRQVLAALATESAVVVVVIGTVLGAASAALALWGAVSG